MDKILTFEYAYNNYGAFQLQPIPNNKKCMTKAEVNAYISVDQTPLNGYDNNRLVPISKISLRSRLPSDITYYIVAKDYVSSGNYNNDLIIFKGEDEYNRLSMLATDDDVTNEVRYYGTLYRKSPSTPSLDAEIAIPTGKEPLNVIVGDMFNLMAFDVNSNNIEMSRSSLYSVGGSGGSDFGDMLYKETDNKVYISQTYKKMYTSSPPFVNPSTHLGIMQYGVSDLPNTNAHNKVRSRELLKTNVGTVGNNQILPFLIRQTENPPENGYWAMWNILNQYECNYWLKRQTDGATCTFQVKYFAPLP